MCVCVFVCISFLMPECFFPILYVLFSSYEKLSYWGVSGTWYTILLDLQHLRYYFILCSL